MSKHNIVISEVVVENGSPVVRGLVGDIGFEATNKRWGSKMLMNVVAEGLDRGQRVAIGQAAKAALRKLEIELPKAELVRPRKPKAEAATPEPLELDGLR
jgi:hypothetical protein